MSQTRLSSAVEQANPSSMEKVLAEQANPSSVEKVLAEQANPSSMEKVFLNRLCSGRPGMDDARPRRFSWPMSPLIRAFIRNKLSQSKRFSFIFLV